MLGWFSGAEGRRGCQHTGGGAGLVWNFTKKNVPLPTADAYNEEKGACRPLCDSQTAVDFTWRWVAACPTPWACPCPCHPPSSILRSPQLLFSYFNAFLSWWACHDTILLADKLLFLWAPAESDRLGAEWSVERSRWCTVVLCGVRCGLAADLKKLKLLHRNCLDRWFMCAFVVGSWLSWLTASIFVFLNFWSFLQSRRLAERQICVAVDIYWPWPGHWHQLCMQYGKLIMPLISHRISPWSRRGDSSQELARSFSLKCLFDVSLVIVMSKMDLSISYFLFLLL